MRNFILLAVLVASLGLAVAIIAILAALLLPAFSKAKAHARRVGCINNQRQLALTWVLYAGDNSERVALNGHDTLPTGTNKLLWVLGDTHFYMPAFTDARFLVHPGYAAFGSYLRAAAIYKCPADQSTVASGGALSTVASGGVKVAKIRSYSMNSYLGWNGPPLELTSGYLTVKRLPQLARLGPAKAFLFQDVLPENLCFPSATASACSTSRTAPLRGAGWLTEPLSNESLDSSTNRAEVSTAERRFAWTSMRSPSLEYATVPIELHAFQSNWSEADE